ncbi:hypothetical protein XENOCAPTIV_021111 [Xenoophorus captivus]|uniref:Uncharacterized protein n=1 Tax=Xenoophorus captivus TaxID=1517983 RepID=A0ABV0QSV6_9TELE
MAVELSRNMSRQPSRESNNGSMNSCNSEGNLIFSGVNLGASSQFSDFLDGLGPAQLVGRQTLATPAIGTKLSYWSLLLSFHSAHDFSYLIFCFIAVFSVFFFPHCFDLFTCYLPVFSFFFYNFLFCIFYCLINPLCLIILFLSIIFPYPL